ncbi:MAG: aminotransferase class IV [Bacteroidetes bacterium]|nr:aminotransferase class IV [Bacteroidota bacterium]MDA0904234.1 aminotransferase class IV [Bacteroidota bacterium]MDA1242984.1 aminotransferase class IV [Bacteroidota bacterium]
MMPSRPVLYNGKVQSMQSVGAPMETRAFLFADGCFESMRWTQGKVPFLSLHVGRLQAALSTRGIDFNPSLEEMALSASLQEWSKTWGFSGDARIRLTAWRAGEGAYLPTSDEVEWVATVEPMRECGFAIPDKGLDVDIYQDMVKPITPTSRFKNLSADVYVQAARHAKFKGWGDALILNQDQKIIESSRSNLFVVSNGVLYTPSLADGCVAGVMRAVVIRLALSHNVKVYECTLTPQALLQADELFLTNAIRGVEWVASYKTKRYFHTIAEKLSAWIQEDACLETAEVQSAGASEDVPTNPADLGHV